MRSGRRMIARVAWAIVVAPVMRCRLIAMFRKVAMTCADVPVRVWCQRRANLDPFLPMAPEGQCSLGVDTECPPPPPQGAPSAQAPIASGLSVRVPRRVCGSTLLVEVEQPAAASSVSAAKTSTFPPTSMLHLRPYGARC